MAYIISIWGPEGYLIKQFTGDSVERIAEMWCDAVVEFLERRGLIVKATIQSDPQTPEQDLPDIRIAILEITAIMLPDGII
ncbi:MAG: hypothetical protein KW802_01380 [Candidatus Doudnabacteria bacterium]|nr:hypothetical protein [Candidatus Doudnabacteria bacterium]